MATALEAIRTELTALRLYLTRLENAESLLSIDPFDADRLARSHPPADQPTEPVPTAPKHNNTRGACDTQVTSIAAQSKTPSAPPERGVYPLYDVISDLNGATTEQLCKRTGWQRAVVVERGRRLMQLGLVRFTGVGGRRMWLPTQSEERDAA
jgi:hypothetical protein